MFDKSGFLAAKSIRIRREAADGDAGEMIFLMKLAHEIPAAQVRQADVADEQVELILAGRLDRIPRAQSRRDLMTVPA